MGLLNCVQTRQRSSREAAVYTFCVTNDFEKICEFRAEMSEKAGTCEAGQSGGQLGKPLEEPAPEIPFPISKIARLGIVLDMHLHHVQLG